MARRVWIAPWLESVWQDLRYGARSLRRSPGFAITALLTLTLGVGVNTTLFSFVNALLLQPWPAADAHQLVRVYHRTAGSSARRLVGVSAPELALLQQATSADVAGTRPGGGPLTYRGVTRSPRGRLVSGNYFDVLKVPMVLGRGLHRDDDQPGRAPVIVLGYDLWTSLFLSDVEVVGQTISFHDVPMTVVGVAGQGVRESPLDDLPAFWIPLAAMPQVFPDEPFAREFLSNAAHCCVDLVARLGPGMSRAPAEAELSVLDRRFRSGEQDGLGMHVTGTETAYDPKAGQMMPVFGLLFAAALLVLLLTCANIGNLQLARAAARRSEVTVRLALGAARRRVVRQFLTEGLVLAIAAVALCLIVSPMVARAVMTRLEAPLARALDFSIDVRVLLFAAALTLVTCLVTSLAPALRGTRHLVAGRASDRPTLRIRSMFLAAQVAISVVLLTAAALLHRGLEQAATQDVGFRIETLMALKVDRVSQSPDADRAVLGAVMSAIENRPVAVAAALPLGDFSFHTGVRRAGEPSEADRPVRYQPVSSNYFDVLGIPLRSGRTFRDGDSNEVVLNETLARMLWPDGQAVGGHVAGSAGTIGRQVVGVVADAHIDGLGAVGPVVFQPAETLSNLLFNKGETTAEELQAIVTGVDPAATTTLRAVGDNVASSLEAATFGARIAGGLGLLALAIAAIGIAGVFSFVVTERTREIGIRLALGASRRRVRTLLLQRASRPAIIGAVIGLALAALGGPVLQGFLYGLSPTNGMVYVAVVFIVALTTWAATILPMRRALRVDPAVALRYE
jgi:predicted permease